MRPEDRVPSTEAGRHLLDLAQSGVPSIETTYLLILAIERQAKAQGALHENVLADAENLGEVGR